MDRTASSPTISLASSPSLRHHPTIHRPHRRTPTTNVEHSWREPPPCGARSNKFPPPRSPFTESRLPETSAVRCSSTTAPSVPVHPSSVAPRQRKNSEAGRIACRVWPGIEKDCRTWGRACQSFQRSKVSRYTITPVGDFTLQAALILQINIDLVQPLAYSTRPTVGSPLSTLRPMQHHP